MHGFADFFTVGIWAVNVISMPLLVGRKRDVITPGVACVMSVVYTIMGYIAYIAVTR